MFLQNWFGKGLVGIKLWFQAKGYHSKLIQKQMSKVSFSGWDRIKNELRKILSGSNASIYYLYPLLKRISNLIRMNLYVIYWQEAQKRFRPGSMISFHNVRDINSCFTPYLVRAKLYPLEQIVGTCFMVTVVTFVKMLQKHQYSLAPWLKYIKKNCIKKCLVYVLSNT